MYERFRERFAIEPGPGCSGEELVALIDPVPDGMADLLIRWAGSSLDGGLYRLHELSGIARWSMAAAEVFPTMAGRTLCFAVDWLGRQYAFDVGREAPNGEPLLMLLDPWSAEPFEIDAVFTDFHEDELVEYADDILATDLWQQWRDGGGLAPGADGCVGYRVPLFAGGTDELANLELMDLGEAWAAVARARSGVPTAAGSE